MGRALKSQTLIAGSIATLLSTAASAFVGFADLPGSAVAQTTGYYNSGQITLDSNAVGWGWYIDPTPLDNTDDYLPTADPNLCMDSPRLSTSAFEQGTRLHLCIRPVRASSNVLVANIV